MNHGLVIKVYLCLRNLTPAAIFVLVRLGDRKDILIFSTRVAVVCYCHYCCTFFRFIEFIVLMLIADSVAIKEENNLISGFIFSPTRRNG